FGNLLWRFAITSDAFIIFLSFIVFKSIFPISVCKDIVFSWNNQQKERKNKEKVEKSHFFNFS
ncbi:MAG: hypothetical protein ACOCO4_04735, partial [Segatella copri]